MYECYSRSRQIASQHIKRDSALRFSKSDAQIGLNFLRIIVPDSTQDQQTIPAVKNRLERCARVFQVPVRRYQSPQELQVTVILLAKVDGVS
jgi:hypothetical protein